MEGHDHILAKRISLCVSGGIAAYKSVEIASRLVKLGYRVQVAMTPSAQNFVGPLTFQAITGQSVFTDMSDPAQEGGIGHIEFAQSCDLLVVAPATANIVAKAALGLGDEPVSTALLATNKPVLFAPAMNTEMWRNPATRQHVATLRARGMRVLEPDSGTLACGTVGPGRLPEPEVIVGAIASMMTTKSDLVDKHVLITGGPTREFLDPVRFLSNPSSGKTAVALAENAARRGAMVTLVMGPTTQNVCTSNTTQINVVSAAEMHHAVLSNLDTVDLVIMSAAVADWTPAERFERKQKKEASEQVFAFRRTRDILQELGDHERRRMFTLVGYAAETEDVIENARQKCLRKNADLIIANDVSDPSSGFATNENQVYLVTPTGSTTLPRAQKTQLAAQILDYLVAEVLP